MGKRNLELAPMMLIIYHESKKEWLYTLAKYTDFEGEVMRLSFNPMSHSWAKWKKIII